MKKTILLIISILLVFPSTSRIKSEIDTGVTIYLVNKLNSYYPKCLTKECDIFIDKKNETRKIDILFGNFSNFESYFNRIVWSEYIAGIIKSKDIELLIANNGEDLASFTNLISGNVRFNITFKKISISPEKYLFYIDPSICYKNIHSGRTYPTIFNTNNLFGKKFPADTLSLEIIEKDNRIIKYSLNQSKQREFMVDIQ